MSQQLDSRNECTVSISTVLVSLVHIVVVGLLSLGSEKQSMSGLPERSLLTAAMQNEQSGTLRWSECPQNKFQQERQVKGAEHKVENNQIKLRWNSANQGCSKMIFQHQKITAIISCMHNLI